MDKKERFENTWSEEEDQVILNNIDLTVRELAELIENRSREAIKKRRQKLRATVGDNASIEEMPDMCMPLPDTEEEVQLAVEPHELRLDLDTIISNSITAFDKEKFRDQQELSEKVNVPIRSVRDRQQK